MREVIEERRIDESGEKRGERRFKSRDNRREVGEELRGEMRYLPATAAADML